MTNHLFEGKYLSPFRTDNPKIIGQLKALEKEFNDYDGVDPKRAQRVLQSAIVLHGEFMNCDFCGQSNFWEHSKSCPLYPTDDRGIPSHFLIAKIYEWESGFFFGFKNESFPDSLLKEPTFMLGFSRGQSERIRAYENDTDCLYNSNPYCKEEYRRISI